MPITKSMLSLFRNRESPPEARPAEAVGESFNLVLDTLAFVLRTYGRHAFDVDGVPAATLAAECERYSQHALNGTPVPGGPVAAIAAGDRSWPEIRRFFGKIRGQEAAFVGKSMDSMRGALWSFAETFRKAFDQDAETDQRIRGELARLYAAFDNGDPETLKRTVDEVRRTLESALEDRAARQAEAMQSLGERLQKVRSDLKEARVKAATDPLTGVPNRSSFDERLQSSLLLNSYHAQPETLLLLDIDHFKTVNDNHGHRAGDHVLKEVARVIETIVVRRSDFVARYGGEEFVVILDDTDEASSVLVAQRLLTAVRDLGVEWEGTVIPVTASIGVAQIHTGDTGPGWLEEADRALYRAKAAGRDRMDLRGAISPPP